MEAKEKDKGAKKAPTPKLTEKVYVAVKEFHDIKRYDVVYQKGDIVKGFDDNRIQRAIDNGLIKEELREV